MFFFFLQESRKLCSIKLNIHSQRNCNLHVTEGSLTLVTPWQTISPGPPPQSIPSILLPLHPLQRDNPMNSREKLTGRLTDIRHSEPDNLVSRPFPCHGGMHHTGKTDAERQTDARVVFMPPLLTTLWLPFFPSSSSEILLKLSR